MIRFPALNWDGGGGDTHAGGCECADAAGSVVWELQGAICSFTKIYFYTIFQPYDFFLAFTYWHVSAKQKAVSLIASVLKVSRSYPRSESSVIVLVLNLCCKRGSTKLHGKKCSN